MLLGETFFYIIIFSQYCRNNQRKLFETADYFVISISIMAVSVVKLT